MPCGVVDGSDLTTMLRMAQLGEKEGSRSLSDGASETDEETGADEHAEALGSGLEGNTEHHEEDTGNDSQTTTEVIRDVRTVTFLVHIITGNIQKFRTYANGRPQMDPIPIMALKRPNIDPLGWLKKVCHAGTIWRPFIIELYKIATSKHCDFR